MRSRSTPSSSFASSSLRAASYCQTWRCTKSTRPRAQLASGAPLRPVCRSRPHPACRSRPPHHRRPESGVLANRAVLDELSGLAAQGVAIGASVSNPQVPTLEAAVAAEAREAPLFASVQATFNLLDQSAGPALEQAAREGVFVIIKESLANGRLTPRATGAAMELLQAGSHRHPRAPRSPSS